MLKLYMTLVLQVQLVGFAFALQHSLRLLSESVLARCRPAAYEENETSSTNSLTEYGYECAKPDGASPICKAPNGDAVAYSEKVARSQEPTRSSWDGFAAQDTSVKRRTANEPRLRCA